MPAETGQDPHFLDVVRQAYINKGKNIILLTGDTLDLFWSQRACGFLPLEQALYQALSEKFVVLRLDAANGISFFDDDDLAFVVQVCGTSDAAASGEKVGDVKASL